MRETSSDHREIVVVVDDGGGDDDDTMVFLSTVMMTLWKRIESFGSSWENMRTVMSVDVY